MKTLYDYKPNWKETRERYAAWWKGKSLGRPMLSFRVRREEVSRLDENEESPPPPAPWDYVNIGKTVADYRKQAANRAWPVESFPCLHVVPGLPLLAEYYGAMPEFRPGTVWYAAVFPDGYPISDLTAQPIDHHPRLAIHEAMLKRAAELAGPAFPVGIPDLMERMDTLAALRGMQEFCYDFFDRPGEVKTACHHLDIAWETAYDRMYEAVKFSAENPGQNPKADEGSAWVAFGVWSQGRTAKLQCDFAAVMNPEQFEEFALPGLRRQCAHVDTSFFHLDGKDALKHADAVLSLERLGALQWTPGAGQPDGANERWWPLYHKARAAGKALWIYLVDGSVDQQIAAADRLIGEIGPEGLYLHFYFEFSEAEAADFIKRAETKWKC